MSSPLGEDWLAGSHGGGGISRQPGIDRRMLLVVMDEQAGIESAVRAVVIYGYDGRYSVGIGNCRWRHCLRPYGGVCVLQADALVVLVVCCYCSFLCQKWKKEPCIRLKMFGMARSGTSQRKCCLMKLAMQKVC